MKGFWSAKTIFGHLSLLPLLPAAASACSRQEKERGEGVSECQEKSAWTYGGVLSTTNVFAHHCQVVIYV